MQVTKKVAARVFEQGRDVTIDAVDYVGQGKKQASSITWNKRHYPDFTLDLLVYAWYNDCVSMKFHVQGSRMAGDKFKDYPERLEYDYYIK